MKENNKENLTVSEIKNQLIELKDKEDFYSYSSKLSFTTSFSLAAIMMLMSSIIPVTMPIGVGVLGVGLVSTVVCNFKRAKYTDEIARLEEEIKTKVEQLAMEDILKESYKPELVKKGKSKSVEKENKNDLNL